MGCSPKAAWQDALVGLYGNGVLHARFYHIESHMTVDRSFFYELDDNYSESIFMVNGDVSESCGIGHGSSVRAWYARERCSAGGCIVSLCTSTRPHLQHCDYCTISSSFENMSRRCACSHRDHQLGGPFPGHHPQRIPSVREKSEGPMSWSDYFAKFLFDICSCWSYTGFMGQIKNQYVKKKENTARESMELCLYETQYNFNLVNENIYILMSYASQNWLLICLIELLCHISKTKNC